MVKNPPTSAEDIRDMSLIPGSVRSSRVKNGNLLQYSYLENPMGRGAWWATFTVCYCCCQVASVVFNSMRPHRRQPTRLPRPWDSPGKDTGVGCHVLLQYMKVKSESEAPSRVRLFVTPWTAAYQASPSMGFSRQEYWSGVPLPSPMKVWERLN